MQGVDPKIQTTIHSFQQQQQQKIPSDWPVGSQVVLTTPNEQHDGHVYATIVAPQTLKNTTIKTDYAGLLSRNITFTNGHFWILRTNLPQRIVGLALMDFGMPGVLGRYPIHFHHCGHAPESRVA